MIVCGIVDHHFLWAAEWALAYLDWVTSADALVTKWLVLNDLEHQPLTHSRMLTVLDPAMASNWEHPAKTQPPQGKERNWQPSPLCMNHHFIPSYVRSNQIELNEVTLNGMEWK